MTTSNDQKAKENIKNALNAHGFLFQQRVHDEIENGDSGWSVEVAEVPVMAQDGTETRIDLLLMSGSNCYLCVECKRASPEYKAWVFFDDKQLIQKSGTGSLFIETIEQNLCAHRTRDKFRHYTQNRKWDEIGIRVFNYYVECSLGNKKRASTEAIEVAFHQVLCGTSGLVEKLVQMHSSDSYTYQVIPIVVTTAELYHAAYAPGDIDIITGTIELDKFKIHPKPYLAVNYHAGEGLGLDRHCFAGDKPDTIVEDLLGRNMRTVFVVQSKKTNDFLKSIRL